MIGAGARETCGITNGAEIHIITLKNVNTNIFYI